MGGSFTDWLERWQYRKAALYTGTELVLFYNFPLSVILAATGTFLLPSVVFPITEQVEVQILEPLVLATTATVAFAVLVASTAAASGLLPKLPDLVHLPLSIAGHVVAAAIGSHMAKKNMTVHQRSALHTAPYRKQSLLSTPLSPSTSASVLSPAAASPSALFSPETMEDRVKRRLSQRLQSALPPQNEGISQ